VLFIYKKLSYRREIARQLPTWREGGTRPSMPLPSAPSGSGVATGGSGGSMNRGPKLLGAPEPGHTKLNKKIIGTSR